MGPQVSTDSRLSLDPVTSGMENLFPISVSSEDIPKIPGLSYVPGYITEDEEQTLTRAIDSMPWDTSWQRRRQPYGSAYGKGGDAPPIPEWGQELAQRLFSDGITREPFNHMLINEYTPGQGIALHRDYAPYARTVVSLSLLSPCVMDLRHPETDRKARVLLERRSLLVLSDEARYVWQHGIAPRKRDTWHGIPLPRGRRLSITFRTRIENSSH